MLVECTDTTVSLDFMDSQLADNPVFQKYLGHNLTIKLPFTSSCVLNYKAYLLGDKCKFSEENIIFSKYIQDQMYLCAVIKQLPIRCYHYKEDLKYLYELIIKNNLTHYFIFKITKYLEYRMRNGMFLQYHEIPDAPFSTMNHTELKYAIEHFPRCSLPGFTTVYVNLCVVAYQLLGSEILYEIADNDFCISDILLDACSKLPKNELSETFKMMASKTRD